MLALAACEATVTSTGKCLLRCVDVKGLRHPIQMGSVTHRRRVSNPLRTVLETVALPKLADRKDLFWIPEIKKAARVGFPMGGSLDMTSPTSWWGACAAQKVLFLPGERLPVVVRRAHDSDRGDRIPALRPPLSHVRHDCSFVCRCAFIIAQGRDRVNHICQNSRTLGYPRMIGSHFRAPRSVLTP